MNRIFLFGTFTACLFLYSQSVIAEETTDDDRLDVYRPENEPLRRVCSVSDSTNTKENVSFIGKIIDDKCSTSKLLDESDALTFKPTFFFLRSKTLVEVDLDASPDVILQAGFDPKKKTMLLIHGFIGSVTRESQGWIFKAKDQYLENSLNEHYNFIAMNWDRASHGGYFEVVSRLYTMGSYLANFIIKLTYELGSNRMDFHLIGYSLGAHIAGFAGQRLRDPKIGRISGIDPAGPCFGKMFGSIEDEQLSADDAYLVDVLHVDSSFLGKYDVEGQFDVYFNGGALQPGCSDNLRTIFEETIKLITHKKNEHLSHKRAGWIATEALWKNGGCQHVAYECHNYEAFKAGECGECDSDNGQCYFLGFPFQFKHPMPNYEAPLRTNGGKRGERYFVMTGSSGHLCLQHSQIMINLVAPNTEGGDFAEREKEHYSFMLELENLSHNKGHIVVNHKKSADVYTHLLLSEGKTKQIYRARVQMKDKHNKVVEVDQLPGPIRDIKINFMSSYDYYQRQAMSTRLCPISVEKNWIEFALC